MPTQTLRDLFAKRDEEHANYEFVAEVYRSAEGEPPAEWTAEFESRAAAIDAIDARILEVAADEKRNAEIAEARKAAGIDLVETVKVKSEPRTYGPGSENSYFADLVRGSSPIWPGYDEARERLDRHSTEISGEMRDPNSSEGKRARRVVSDTQRGDNKVTEVRDAVDRAANLSETRTGMTTGSSSGGSFVTPEYFVADYAPYRQFGRVFADQANKQDLPPFGVTIYLPSVSTAASVAAQVGENQGVSETDPTAAYLSTSLTTNAGQVTISQQLLDRAGPNFQFDKMVFDQLERAYNLTLDTYVLTQATANANSVVSNYSSLTPQTLLQKIAGGKANIADTAGTVLPATHIFAPVSTWEYITAQVDTTSGRPAFPTTMNGPFNAFGSGDPHNMAEGDTGYKVLGLPVFEDQNIPQDASAHNQILVTHMPEVWFWEGDLVPRVIPQTFAQNLSVLLQVYAYVGCIVRYPKAVQTISGSGLNVTF